MENLTPVTSLAGARLSLTHVQGIQVKEVI